MRKGALAMQSWAARELQYAQLGDPRRNRRLVRLVEDLAMQPTASVPQASGTWAATKAAYRFWSNEQVTPAAIRKSHSTATVERIKGHTVVLAIQDTTELDFAHHPKTRGLGPLNNTVQYGMKVHSCLAVSTDGVPLGLVRQEAWVRDSATLGIRHQRRKRKTADKESQRWLDTLTATQDTIPADVSVVTIADSEADIYDLFTLARRPGSHLLVRGTHNRRVDHTARYIWDALRAVAVVGRYTLQVHRKDGQPARVATMTVRYTDLDILPPRHHQQRAQCHSVHLHVLLVEEENPSAGVTPITWLLLTTLPIQSLDDALRYIRWYSYRWLIERYHFVLKSGCHLEQLQLEERSRIERALATYGIVAWRLLWLTYEARQQPEASAATVLERHEWESLYCTIHHTVQPPADPPTLRQAVRWIAQLGGFLARTHDGEPGVKLIWHGLRRLHDIAATWQLAHTGLSPSPHT